ncbi:hypothetical protein HPA02_32490 [Bisbaumannia pacifica]|uniref:O-antigen ligase-related domain-containing protein n=1 Tax=Bisbaumannia pacifica TaxID=77098 RepID=A0A510XC18_9GAMM|nr:O-antigen ligase family protein [Halomonas pacifica]GEK48966.1 hypothetical protein HPA02_32490 [Halomonas pacifica]
MLTFPSSPLGPGHITSLAAFLLAAVALILPSGYSLGALVLVLMGVWTLATGRITPPGQPSWLVILVLVAFSVVGIVTAVLDGQGWRGVDKPLRPLLAAVALLALLRYPPRLAWVWSGVALGALGAGSWATWQKLVVGVARAEGHTYVIQFGNLSMLLGVLCLAGLGFAYGRRHRRLWLALMLLGAVAGILGSLFSGSRGGWVGFPVILLVLYRGYGDRLATRRKAALAVGILVAVSAVYLLPQTGVQQRVHQAIDDVSRYVSGESQTSSVGARFEMWKGASRLILDKPLLGWGDDGYQAGMQALAEADVIHPGVTIYSHAHNEFIDTFAKQGIIGLLALLALYLVPMRLFSRRLEAADLTQRSVAIAGVLLPVAYIDFGLSQAFLSHNSGIMMYGFLLVVLWASHCQHAGVTQAVDQTR